MKPNRMKITAAAVLMLLFVPLLAHAGEGKIRRSPHAVKDEYIVVLRDDIPRDQIPGIAHALTRAHGGTLERVWQDALKGFFVRMTEGQAQGLSHHPQVKYIEENAQMFLSGRVPTNVDPACDPPNNCGVDDNRLWHLDVLDQKSVAATHDYAYCSDGSNVYIYVIDTGVMASHREFSDGLNRVQYGYNAARDNVSASVDHYPANDPCHGTYSGLDNSHGTGVASLAAGKNIGVARNAKIVPIKVARCADKVSQPIQRSTFYSAGTIVKANSSQYIAKTSGTTGATAPTTWSWPPPHGPGVCCTQDGGVSWEWVGTPSQTMTVQMTIEGLDWILRPTSQGGNPYPKSPAVVTLSTYRVVGTPGVSSPPDENSSISLEDTIANLLKYNNGHGITVIASANNQDANACDTSPGRMSRNNPNNPNDANKPYKVITAGGTMIRNNPDPNPDAKGGSAVDSGEPAHDSSKPPLLARWRCHAGDSDDCGIRVSPFNYTHVNIYSTPPPTVPNPATSPDNYAGTTLGSNGGACVTLFAPAKNIPVASMVTTSSYRNSRASSGLASGTSWSAPIVAGMAARILQNNTGYSIQQVYDAMMAYTTETLDTQELNPPNVTGTPRNVLQITDVAITVPPASKAADASGSTQLTVTATGTAPLTYEWYQVNPQFNLNVHDRDAVKATKISGATSNTLTVTNPTVRTGYFVRVRSSCGSADSDIAVIFPKPAAPTSLRAARNGSGVDVTWTASSNAEVYHLDRKVQGQPWQLAVASTTKPAWGGSAPTTLTDTAPAWPDDRVVVYRVRASSGDWDVPEAQRAFSNPSNLDFAFQGAAEPNLVSNNTKIKAAHVIELRKAINAIADAAENSAQKFTAAELLASSLIPPNAVRNVLASDFTDIRDRLNALRTSASYNVGSVSFTTTPGTNVKVLETQITNLRTGLE